MTQVKQPPAHNGQRASAQSKSGPVLPPFDSYLEEQVLGSLIIEDSLIFDVGSFLKDDDFYIQSNGLIYSHILTMKARGQAVDITSLSREIQDAGHTKDTGGDLRLQKLVGELVSTYSARDNALKIQELAIRRKVLIACSEIAQAAYTLSMSPEDLANKVQSATIDALGGARKKSKTLKQATETWEKQFSGFIDANRLPGIPFPFPSLNAVTGGAQGTKMYLFSAPTGAGKSTVLKAIALHAARLGYKVGIWSLEMSEEEYAESLISEYGEFDTQIGEIVNLNQQKKDDLKAKAKWASAQVSLLPIQIFHRPGCTVDQLRFEARAMRSLNKLDLIIVDYVQLMTTDRHKDQREQQMRYISQTLKEISQEIGIPLLTAAQLNKQDQVRESTAIVFNADVYCRMAPSKAAIKKDARGCELQTLKVTMEKNRSGAKRDFYILFNRSHRKVGETTKPATDKPAAPAQANPAAPAQKVTVDLDNGPDLFPGSS